MSATFSLSPFSSRNHVIAIADIQSDSVSIAIALSHQDRPLEIIAIGRSDLSYEERTPEAAIAALPEQIAQAGKEAFDAYQRSPQAHGRVDRVLAVINTPWARSQTIRTVAKFDTEVTVTDAMIADLAKQALDESTEVDPSNLLEANVVRIELNGYPTPNPVGLHAHKVSVYALVSGCLPEVHKIAQESLEKIFPHTPITFRSQLRTVLSVIESFPSVPKDYCLIDVGRDATIIANIHTSRSMAHTTVGEGSLSIIKRVTGKGLPEETIALLRMVADDTCSTDACAQVIEAMAHVETVLVRTFAEAMISLAEERYLPPTAVLLCDTMLTRWLSEFFARIDFTQFTNTTRPFSIVPLNAASLSAFVAVPPKTAVETRLLLACALVNIEDRHV